MARHAKKKQLPVRWIVTSIVSVAAVGLVIVGILLVNNGVLDALAGHFYRLLLKRQFHTGEQRRIVRPLRSRFL